MPFLGRVIEERLDYWEVNRACRANGATAPGRIEGCAWTFPDELAPGGTACRIIIPDKDAKAIRKHEMGHCNGWPAHHPHGRYK